MRDIPFRHLKFPISAIASIMHRLTGIAMGVGVLGAPWAWHRLSLSNASYQQVLHNVWFRLCAWLWLSCLSYHVVAGMRHSMMDFGYCEGKRSGQISAWIVLMVGALTSIGWGWWLI
jgi:succinate dehydrogenase / fumarate reductase, cytochrome b subunit